MWYTNNAIEFSKIQVSNLDEEIKDIISVWKEIVETKIIPVVKTFNTYYEGNIFSLDKTYHYNVNFLDKQKNIILSCKQPNVKNVLNIGYYTLNNNRIKRANNLKTAYLLIYQREIL